MVKVRAAEPGTAGGAHPRVQDAGNTLPAPVRELFPTDDELASAVGETLTDLKESRSLRDDAT